MFWHKLFHKILHKKKNDNPLHTEYGIVSNSFYILKKIRQYCPILLVTMGTGVITNSVTRYLWSFIGKFVIDIIQAQAATPEKEIAPLIRLVVLKGALHELSDAGTAKDPRSAPEGANCIPIPDTGTYTFEFRDVSYKYEGSETYALRHLNLTLEAGKKLAVVGLNGAGKTTFIKLLLRLYDVTEGAVLLNGIDIRRFRRRETKARAGEGAL